MHFRITRQYSMFVVDLSSTKKYVLTAAHCHNEEIPEKVIKEVVVGEHVVGQDRDCVYDRTTGKCEDIGLPPAQKRGVERVIIHENWNVSNYRGGSDIALVRVDKPIVMFFDDLFASQVVPICLPWNEEDPTVESIQRVDPNQ